MRVSGLVLYSGAIEVTLGNSDNQPDIRLTQPIKDIGFI